MSEIRLTTARYYTPSGESIQGKGIEPDIEIKQGTFESTEYKSFSEADLKDSLDNNLDKKNADANEDEDEDEIIRLKNDYQLSRAIDLIHAVNVFKQTIKN